jgi:SAM-dependent methyltransferase
VAAGLDPTGRFSSRVDDYVRYRPSYPPEIIRLLTRDCGLSADSTVADIGSGTGFLTQPFLDFGCAVIGVEPNQEMRAAGERILSRYQKFTSIDGRAEHTGLADSSVDLVAAGQAFHWFDVPAARLEFRRILRSPRWVALVWNERLVTGEFLAGYEGLMRRYAPDYGQIDHRRIDAQKISDFFQHRDWKLATFPNVQHFDWPGLRGRLDSSSYAPRENDANYGPLMQELRQLFEAHQQNGHVDFAYDTNLYYGML